MRGRFNLGEKLVIAACEEATIATTTGTVTFDPSGRLHHPRRKRPAGTRFEGILAMTRSELAQMMDAARQLIPPDGVITTLNGEPITQPLLERQLQVALPTETADAEGYLRPTRRKTTVALYRPAAGETAMLHELGIPVVELPGGDAWHVDVRQKVPLNTDRDNVTPAFLRELRVAVLNATADLVRGDASADRWVGDALADSRVSPEAVRRILQERFGEKAVVADPSDREAENIAKAKGYTVIPPRAFNREQWRQIRAADAVRPAGQVTPSPKPFSPDGSPLAIVDPAEYDAATARTITWLTSLAGRLTQRAVTVQVTDDRGWGFDAAYGSGQLTLNRGRLGRRWFRDLCTEEQLSLLVHELSHETRPPIRGSRNHLAEDFHEAACRLAGRLTRLALSEPDLFDPDTAGPELGGDQ